MSIEILDEFEQPEPLKTIRRLTVIQQETPNTEQEKGKPRGKTQSIKRLSKREIARGMAEFPTSEFAHVQRPVTRGDCLPGGCNEQRPCPFVSCKHHLYLDVNDKIGSIKVNFPEREVWDMKETCTLDIADKHEITLEEVGLVMNLTRERVRQLETRGLAKLKALSEAAALQDWVE